MNSEDFVVKGGLFFSSCCFIISCLTENQLTSTIREVLVRADLYQCYTASEGKNNIFLKQISKQ